jgi:hypothetical protein
MIRFEAWNKTSAGMGRFYRSKHESVIIIQATQRPESRLWASYLCARVWLADRTLVHVG